jgi:hypothetical protein
MSVDEDVGELRRLLGVKLDSSLPPVTPLPPFPTSLLPENKSPGALLEALIDQRTRPAPRGVVGGRLTDSQLGTIRTKGRFKSSLGDEWVTSHLIQMVLEIFFFFFFFMIFMIFEIDLDIYNFFSGHGCDGGGVQEPASVRCSGCIDVGAV